MGLDIYFSPYSGPRTSVDHEHLRVLIAERRQKEALVPGPSKMANLQASFQVGGRT